MIPIGMSAHMTGNGLVFLYQDRRSSNRCLLKSYDFIKERNGGGENESSISETERSTEGMHFGKMYRKGRFQATIGLRGLVQDAIMDQSDVDIASRLRLILLRLDQRYAIILLNDFFEIKEQDWWKAYFNQTAYDHYKRLAVTALLNELYTETV